MDVKSAWIRVDRVRWYFRGCHEAFPPSLPPGCSVRLGIWEKRVKKKRKLKKKFYKKEGGLYNFVRISSSMFFFIVSFFLFVFVSFLYCSKRTLLTCRDHYINVYVYKPGVRHSDRPREYIIVLEKSSVDAFFVSAFNSSHVVSFFFFFFLRFVFGFPLPEFYSAIWTSSMPFDTAEKRCWHRSSEHSR